MKLTLAKLAVVIIGAGAGASHAAPPPNPDPGLSRWFGDLVDPDTGIPCCDETDCRVVEERVTNDHFEVLLEGRWHTVPAEKVLRRRENPIGRAVLCYSKALGIMCFVPGSSV